MQALVLAGGRAARLNGALGHTPKCLFHVAGRPLIDYALASAERIGAREYLIFAPGVGSAQERIRDHIRTTKWANTTQVFGGLSRSTAEAVLFAAPHLREPFLCLHANVVPNPASLATFRSLVDAFPNSIVSVGSAITRASTHPVLHVAGDTLVDVLSPGRQAGSGASLCSLESYYCPRGTLEELAAAPEPSNEMFAATLGRMVRRDVPAHAVNHQEDWYHLATQADLERDIRGIVALWSTCGGLQ